MQFINMDNENTNQDSHRLQTKAVIHNVLFHAETNKGRLKPKSLFLNFTIMGFDLIPIPEPCIKKNIAVMESEKCIDCNATDCPFKSDRNPLGLRASFCWFSGKTLSKELKAIGEETLSALCYEDMSSRQAKSFGKRLLKLAQKIRKRYKNVPESERPRGAGWSGVLDRETSEWVWQQYSTFDEMLKTIEAGGKWYIKVASFGCEVVTMY